MGIFCVGQENIFGEICGSEENHIEQSIERTIKRDRLRGKADERFLVKETINVELNESRKEASATSVEI